MVDFDDTSEDLDKLIDRAVDTFFVEEPDPEERAEMESSEAQPVPDRTPEPKDEPPAAGPSFEEAVDTLFMSAFQEEKPPDSSYDMRSWITSGDSETDRAIDLAVDTLFIEEPESAAPETTELDVKVIKAAEALAGRSRAVAEPKPSPPKPRKQIEPVPAPEALVSSAHPVTSRDRKPTTQPATPTVSYDDAMAQEIQRQMHTIYKEASREPIRGPAPARPVAAPSRPGRPSKPESFPLRNLQEAILTLEWEISQRSVTTLAGEIRKVRAHFKDNVTVDFAVLSMRVVLDYVVKRMSRAHPESIRFLLDITDYLGKGLASSMEDPLEAFHHILNRYEKYKTSVRRAEGIPDSKPPIVDALAIKDPDGFSRTVTMQALTLKKAGQALVAKLETSQDPENLIRSFRFLVNRALNRILESTCGQKPKAVPKKKGRRRA